MLNFDDMNSAESNNGGDSDSDTSKRVEVSDKQLINCNKVDVNQLMPLKYKWAW